MSTCKFLWGLKFSAPLCKYQGKQLLGYMVRVYLLVYKTAKLSFKVAVSF